MRTTINLPGALLEEAKAKAKRENRTLTSLIEEGLRTVLDEEITQSRFSLPSFNMGKMLIDPVDKNSINELLYGDEVSSCQQ